MEVVRGTVMDVSCATIERHIDVFESGRPHRGMIIVVTIDLLATGLIMAGNATDTDPIRRT